LITENQQLKDDLGFDIYLDTSGIDCLQEAQSVRAEKAQTITNAIVNLNSQVRSGVITPEIAVKLMVSEWGFEQQEAIQFIVSVPNTPDPNNNQ
jgi:hypothetical protein